MAFRLRLLALFAVMLGLVALPARAAIETDHLKRSVVRVVLVTQDDAGNAVPIGHGSGFAVTPTEIVTNAHVTEPYLQGKAEGRPMGIWIVPARGGKVIQGKVTAYDPAYDLSVVTLIDATLPRVTLYSGPISADTDAVVLGYPGNVDTALGRSDATLIVPAAPEARDARITSVNTSGAPWNPEKGVLVNDVPTAPGDSGGAFADACGRVLGVNSRATGDTGISNYHFAIAGPDLRQFLRESNVDFFATPQPCESAAAFKQKQLETRLAERDKDIETITETQAKAAAATRSADFKTLLLGLVLLGGAGFAYVRYRQKDQRQAAFGGVAAVAALFGIVTLQSGGAAEAVTRVLPDNVTAKCALDPVASHIIFDTDDNNTKTEFVLKDGQCVGGNNSIYARDGDVIRHATLDRADESVSTATVDLASGRWEYKHYLLQPEPFAKAQSALSQPSGKCAVKGDNKAAQAAEAARLAALAPALPEEATETIVWKCKPVTPPAAPEKKS